MRIVLGVGGGIAAYKVCEVASRLTQAGHEIYVVMTEAARQFVAPLTFEALTHFPVSTAVTDTPLGPLSHVRLAHSADLIIIAPLTAGLMSRLAQGQPSDMLTAVYLGARCPVLAAPAMEPEMWAHPAVRRQRDLLLADGVRFLGPALGRMASGLEGLGRMVEASEIIDTVPSMTRVQDLLGLRVAITAGPTWEFFDPVRVLTNPSTGVMGSVLARAARDRGAEVTLIHGPMAISAPTGVKAIPVVSAEDMRAALEDALPHSDVVVGAAAVSDFRAETPSPEKMNKRLDGAPVSWTVVPNPDLLALASQDKGHRILVGFAAETSGHVEKARAKLARKHLDLIVANRVEPGWGFGHQPSEAWLVWPDGRTETVVAGKEVLAHRIWDAVGEIRAARG